MLFRSLSPGGTLRFRHVGRSEITQLSDPLASAHDLGLSLGQAIKDEAGDDIVL